MEIYALCDKELLNDYQLSLKEYISCCIKHNVSVIQFRDKSSSFEEKKVFLLEIRKLWNLQLIVNDTLELVEYCDGIHLGQEDLSAIDLNFYVALEKVKEIIGNKKIVGLSTHNREEIEIANRLDLDYIGLGAYRSTATKDVTTILGDDLDALAKISKHKVAAIGGVTLNDNFKNVTYLVIGSALMLQCKKGQSN